MIRKWAVWDANRVGEENDMASLGVVCISFSSSLLSDTTPMSAMLTGIISNPKGLNSFIAPFLW